jgi:hypothetical protein
MMKSIISFEPKLQKIKFKKKNKYKLNFTGKYNLNSGGNSSSE